MKKHAKQVAAWAILSFGIIASAHTLGQDAPPAGTPPPKASKEKVERGDADLVPLELKLPKPAFKGTPQNVPPGTNLEKPRKGPRPPHMAPKSSVNVAAGKPVTSSDRDPIIGKVDLITDGDKEANDGSFVELGPKLQYVQIDLQKPLRISAVLVWHYHANPRVYHDVVVQLADDPDFITNVRTLFNNDHDNSSGLGVGEDMEYWDTYEGKLIDGKNTSARYVRLYSQGSTADDQNHYTEVEVYAPPDRN